MKKIVVLSVVVLAVILTSGCNLKDTLSKKSKSAKAISQEEAKEKIENFIQGNLLAAGVEFSIEDISEENGLYKMKIVVSANGQEQKVDSYISKDGKLFFPSGAIDIDEMTEQAQKLKAAAEEAKIAEQKEIPKNAKPEVDLYVMSFCPFGNKAEDTMKPVYELLKNKINFNIHYIVQSDGDKIHSLHGEKEVIQNEREVCVLKNYGMDKWFGFSSYVNTNCGSDGACWEAAAKNLGVSVEKIKNCVSVEGVSLMKAEAKISTEAGASSSPAMKINGVSTRVVYQYGNAEEYKKAICDSFEKMPVECSKELSSQTDTASGGSCE